MNKIISMQTLVPYFTWDAILRTSLGVVFELRGKLSRDNGPCWYRLDLPEGQSISFSWGRFSVDESTKTIIITIN